MTEKNALKMNLDHERKIVELQSRVNKLENHYCPRNSFNISKSNKLIVTHQN